MSTIHTVTGTIDSTELGATLMHEHVIATSITMQHYFGESWLPEEFILSRAIPRFERAKENGIRSIVDCTPLNLGRDIKLLAKVSQATGINILASTGMFHVTDFAALRLPAVSLAQYFIEEFTDGIQGTAIKPAVFKCAVEYATLSACDEKYLEIAAITQQVTGCPIYLHTQAKFSNGIAAAKFLLEHGANPEKLIVGHVLDGLDIDYSLQLLDLGVQLCCDRIFEKTDEFEPKVSIIAGLLKRGYGDRITLSHDYICCENKWNTKQTDELRPASVHDNPNALAVISTQVLPVLRASGIAEDELTRIMLENPRKLLEIQ